MTADCSWAEPKTNSAEDKVASDLYIQFNVSVFFFASVRNCPHIINNKEQT